MNTEYTFNSRRIVHYDYLLFIQLYRDMAAALCPSFRSAIARVEAPGILSDYSATNLGKLTWLAASGVRFSVVDMKRPSPQYSSWPNHRLKIYRKWKISFDTQPQPVNQLDFGNYALQRRSITVGMIPLKERTDD